MTRHPKLGAAQQLWLLYRNQKEIRDLGNLRRCRAPEVPICELVDFEGFLLLCASIQPAEPATGVFADENDIVGFDAQPSCYRGHGLGLPPGAPAFELPGGPSGGWPGLCS